MWQWLKSLFSSPLDDTRVESSANAVLPFLRTCHQQIDQRDFTIPRHHFLIYCFAYGALDVEASLQGMSESHQLAALLLIVRTLAQLNQTDQSAFFNQCMTTLESDEGKQFTDLGSQYYQSWQAGDPKASSLLAEHLRQID